MEPEKSALPTRKWMATQVTAIAALVTAWVTAEDWNTTLSIALVGLIGQAVVSYLVPNVGTAGGVPVRAELVPSRP